LVLLSIPLPPSTCLHVQSPITPPQTGGEGEHCPVHYCRGYESNINSVNFNMILVASRNKNYTKIKLITKPLDWTTRGVGRPSWVSRTAQSH